MELKHYINNREIDEPVGFDSLKMVMKRGEYHGMSAEVSEQTLEFYGRAADMIHDAYNTDIDTELRYIVMSDGTEVYNGVIDLSTYEEQRSQYYSVSCKVGEVGVKTTFNNRADTEVSINGEDGIDGNTIVAPTEIDTVIQPIPILYTNKWVCDKELSKTHKEHEFTIIPILKTSANEFGEHKLGSSSEINIQTGSNPIPIFDTDEDHPTYDVEIRLKGIITIKYANPPSLVNEHVTLYAGNKVVQLYSGEHDIDYTFKITNYSGELYIYIDADGGRGGAEDHEVADMSVSVTLSLTTDSYYKTTYLDDNYGDNTISPTTLIGNAIDCISQKIAGIHTYSDWYKADFASNSYGGGGLRAITSGYKLRNAKDNFTKRDVFVSFKDIIQALSALDCIGWCFSEKNNESCIRVERWDWFYKTGNPILRITSPNEIKTTVDMSYIVSELQIGYKKYTSNEDIASIDSVHTERTYMSNLKAVQSVKQALCGFIADPYAIELTRRKANEYDVSDWKYDENIFLLEIWHYREREQWGNGVFAAGDNASNLLTGFTLNASLSPRRNAERWKDFVFFANKKSDLVFSSGTGNYEGAYSNDTKPSSVAASLNEIYRPADTVGDVIHEYPTYDYVELPLIRENQPIAYKDRIFKAETLSFKYPLTISQYKAIKANPYGLIEVDGIQGWIKEFTYTFNTGEAEFKLIPKA